MAGVVACLFASGLEIPPRQVAIQNLLSNSVDGLLERRQAAMGSMIDEYNKGDATDYA